MAVQAVIGAIGSGTGQTSSPTATGSAVGSGHCVVGAVAYFNTNATGDFISSVSDGTFSYPLLDHIVSSDSKFFVTTFARFSISNAPTGLTANFSSAVTFSQVGWIEYVLAGGIVIGHTGQSQNSPGTGTDAITSGAATAGTGPVVGFCGNRSGLVSIVHGTGFVQQFFDSTNGDWGFMGQDKTGTGGTAAATFTDTAAGGSTTYNTLVINLQASACGSLPLLGVGCGIWMAKKIEENPILRRRSLILPSLQ